MNVLVLGGTQFVGRAIVDRLLARGHTVTLFTRGKTNADLFPDCARIEGDRTEDIAKACDTHWDAVIDVSGYLPSQMLASTGLKTDFYTFVSTISIYDRDGLEGPFNEETRQFGEGSMDDTTVTAENYGPLKVTCERIVSEAFPANHAMIRPGIVIGPHDHTGRFPYWISRLDTYDEVLVPDVFGERFQGIDSRDLAEFTVLMTEQKAVGAWNAVGPIGTFGEMIDEVRKQSGREHTLVVASPEELEKVDVKMWQDLPVCLPPGNNTFHFDPSFAITAGLTHRALSATITDTLEWVRSLDAEITGKYGMSREREGEAIAKLKAL